MNRALKWMFILGFAGALLVACAPMFDPTSVSPEYDATVIASFQTDLPDLFSGKRASPGESAATVPTSGTKKTQTSLAAVSSDTTKPAFPAVTAEDAAKFVEATASPESMFPEVVSLESERADVPIAPMSTESSAIVETDITELSPAREPLEVKISPINSATDMHTLALVAITPLVTISPVPAYEEREITPLQFNAPDFSKTVEKSLAIGATDSYSFLAEEGQYLFCKLSSAEKDLGLSLFDRYGNDLFANVDPTRRLLIKIPTTGWYRLEVEGDKASTDYRLDLSLPIVISLSKELPSLHMTEKLSAGGFWRLGSEVETEKLLSIKLNSDPGASFKLTIRDLTDNSFEIVEGLKIIEWISPKGFGNRFMIELENIGKNTVVDLILEQLPSIQV